MHENPNPIQTPVIDKAICLTGTFIRFRETLTDIENYCKKLGIKYTSLRDERPGWLHARHFQIMYRRI